MYASVHHKHGFLDINFCPPPFFLVFPLFFSFLSCHPAFTSPPNFSLSMEPMLTSDMPLHDFPQCNILTRVYTFTDF